MKRVGKVVLLHPKQLDKWDVLRFIQESEGNVTMEELNQRFSDVYDEEIGEAVIEYLAARRSQVVRL
ncbi:hypothetical protein [Thermaerobacillus caldiproteolyticus]|uniref:hypothetical protein n=1 Tax=Thermaerobacillus caldiproteolyticus TaxID=247480 RepID=UPI0018F2155E|nr:hypothetical protein [Anoxybacillus caldiproteolyticus]